MAIQIFKFNDQGNLAMLEAGRLALPARNGWAQT